jgi:hypothetical protein
MGLESFAVKRARFAVKWERSHMGLDRFAVKCAPFAVKCGRSHMCLERFAVTRRGLQGVGEGMGLIRAASRGWDSWSVVVWGKIADFRMVD